MNKHTKRIVFMDGEYYVYGVTNSGDPIVCPSIGMARAVLARGS